MDKVQQVCNETDPQAILNCPIANANEDSEEEQRVDTSIWKVVAKLPVLPKIRVFGWRLGQNALPVGQKLHVAQLGSGICRLCETETESLLHAVRECKSVQEICREAIWNMCKGYRAIETECGGNRCKEK
ncbi:hypothetical protein V6N13_133724 [Hibiscus sabdariffa]